MKIQDVVFFVVFLGVLVSFRPRLAAGLGLLCLLLSVPLFSLWIFFTAQRLTWYAAAFFFVAIVLFLFRDLKHSN